MRIQLLGAPASGKGTVAAKLVEVLGVKPVSPGKLLRALPEDHQHYEEVQKLINQGLLAPTPVVADLLREELKKDEYKDGYILDGWMRNLDQKNYFDPEPDWTVFINIADETAIKRISGRRICKETGETFNIYTFSEKELEKYKDCKKVIQRDDDTEEVIKTRLELFHRETMPVVDWYREQGILIEIDGEGTPDEVLDLTVKALKEANDKNKE